MNILIADDHEVFRRGVRHILSEGFPEARFGEAGDAQEILGQLQARGWDLVVLDVRMPGPSGLDVLRQIKVLRPRLPVLMLSMFAEEQFAVRSLRAGASGYLCKDAAAEELLQAARRVLGGGRYVSAALAERLAATLTGEVAEQPHEALSDREMQVLMLLAAGRTATEIGTDLCLSVKTVSTYRKRILEKTGLTTTADLVRYAMEHGLVS